MARGATDTETPRRRLCRKMPAGPATRNAECGVGTRHGSWSSEGGSKSERRVGRSVPNYFRVPNSAFRVSSELRVPHSAVRKAPYKKKAPRPESRAPSSRRTAAIYAAAGLAWRRDLAAAGRLGLGPRSRLLLAVLGLLAADAVRRRPSADRRRPSSASGFGGVLLLGLGVRIVLAADELDLRDLGAVAAAVAEAQDPRVAAGPRREARRERLEQLADDVACRARPRATSRRAWSGLPLPVARRRRRAWRSVMMRSTNGRSSFAFGIVVSMRSCRSSAVAWFRSIAMRCSVTRPSLRCGDVVIWHG